MLHFALYWLACMLIHHPAWFIMIPP